MDRREAISLGITQLGLMMRYGLLLTPEALRIPINGTARNRERPRTEFKQARACFTLVEDRRELWLDERLDGLGRPTSHVKLFGEFAIGLDAIRARELGAVPVIYFYAAAGGAHAGVSHEVLYTLRELRSLAIALARLEAKAGIPERDTLAERTLDALGYVLEGDPVVRERIGRVDEEGARAAIDLLDTDRRPAWNLVGWIDAVLGLFQTADSEESQESLSYYQEREWRIARLFSSAVRCRRLGVEEASGETKVPDWIGELRERLKALDGEFFAEHRLDASAILNGTRDRSFFDFVEEVVCPLDAERGVAELLDWRVKAERAEDGGLVVFRRPT